MSKTTHKFVSGLVDNGKWLAISPCAPYFCFEGESLEEVEALANRALDFYFGVPGSVTQTNGRAKTLSTFSPRRTTERERICA